MIPSRLRRIGGHLAERPAWSAACALALVVVTLCHRTLLGGEVYHQRDISFMWYTRIESAVRSIAQGRWPVWDPYTAFGQPLWADPNVQVLYPFTWLNLVLRPWTVYTLYVAFHLLGAGLGLYVLARRCRLAPMAATIAATMWIASGPIVSLLNVWNQLAGAAWIPWIGVAAWTALAAPSLHRIILWGLTLAAPILAGSPEGLLMSLALVLALLPTLWQQSPATARRRWPAAAAGAGVFALLLSAGQWWPALLLTRRSVRAAAPAFIHTFWSVHPLNLVQALWPIPLKGVEITEPLRTLLFDGREPFLASLYLGLPMLMLCACALNAARGRLALPIGALGVVAFLLALGRHTPVYGFLVALVPPLGGLRYPAKAMVLASVCLALLAGIGFDALSRRMAPSRWSRAAVVGCLAAAVLLPAVAWSAARVGSPAFQEILELARGMSLPSVLVTSLAAVITGVVALVGRFPKVVALVMGVLAVSELVLIHTPLNPTAPRELYTIRPPLLDRVASPTGGRLYVYDYSYPGKSLRYLGVPGHLAVTRGPVGWSFDASQALSLRLYLFHPSAGAWGREGSFDLEVAGLAPVPLARLVDALRAVEETPSHLRLLQLGSVSHVVALHERGFEDLRAVGQGDALLPVPVRIFEVPDPRPRAYVVSGVVVADGVEALHALVDPAFDPTRQVVLPAGVARPITPGFSGEARIVHRASDQVTLEAVLPSEGYLVLVDAHDPGWRATVDGVSAPVLRGNVGFRAVKLAGGRHRVELVYRPDGLRTSVAVSLLAALAAAAVLVSQRRNSSPTRIASS